MRSLKMAINENNINLLENLLIDKTPEVLNWALYWAIDKAINEESIWDNSKQLVKLILNHSTNASELVKTKLFVSVFTLACLKATSDIVKLMLDHGADLTSIGEFGHCTLEIVFLAGDEDKINLFLDHGVRVEDIDRLQLLHFAVNISVNLAKRLLLLGADVNLTDNLGQTVLHWAIQSKNLQMVKLLIDNGASLNSTLQSELELALIAGQLDIIEFLLSRGASTNQGSSVHPLVIAINCPTIDRQNKQRVVKLLLDHGSNVNGHVDRATPICSAVKQGYEEIVELLLSSGAKGDKYLMKVAIEAGRLSVLKLLVDRGFDVNWSIRGTTILTWAVIRGKREFVEFLLLRGAQVNKRSLLGFPLHYAAAKGDVAIVGVLLDHGADLNSLKWTKTAMTLAAEKGRDGVCELLTRQMILMETIGLSVNREDLNFVRTNERLVLIVKECLREIQGLKWKKFDDCTLSCLDVLRLKDNCGLLAGLARNENVKRVLLDCEFASDYPIYGRKIVERFQRGITMNKDFDVCKRFVDRLTIALPFTFVCELFKYLDDEDFANLRNL